MARKSKKVEIKLNKKDFDASTLPTTRKAQFKDILTHEFKTLLLLGMWLVIFFIPFLLVESFSNMFMYTYLEQNIVSMTEEETKSFELLFTLVKESSLVFTFMIFSIGVAGCLRIIRNLVYGEVIFFKNDFILGIKKYWKLALLCGFLFGLFKGATNILVTLVRNYGSGDYLYLFSGFTLGFFYILIVPFIFFIISLLMTYELTFAQTINASIRFTFSNLLVSLAFSGVLFALMFIWYINILLIINIILLVLMLFIGPIYILLWHLYVTSKFDKYINEKQFPTIYKKGLAKGE